MVQNMVKYFNSNPEDITTAIGPSIGSCCYEIGYDVEILFKEKYSKNLDIIIKKDGKTYLNLWEANKINLINLGINENNIFSGDYCTSCNVNTLYSYRKEKGTKNRMIAAIMLNQ
jgi:copper oxidase (laccase) domain-containing protein